MRRGISIMVGLVALLLIPATVVADGTRQFASATLLDQNGHPTGFALFSEQNGSVLVTVHTSGLTPGAHGMHVHEVGSCVAPGFTSAGSHFNPTGEPHGMHAGDLGNIWANNAGQANKTIRTGQITLSAGPLSVHDLDGSALVIHAFEDDLQYVASAGPRVLCGVIEP